MTKLSSFLAETNKTQAAFADEIGVTPGYMSLVVAGKRAPSLIVAVKIYRATGGRVPVSSWVAPEAHGNPLPGFQPGQTDNLTDLPQS